LNKLIDITINIAVPITLGTALYFMTTEKVFRNYLPDGLWAYALTSCVLIIWNRTTNLLWLCLTGSLFLTFEFLQSMHFIKGTGDLIDAFIYFAFGLLALSTNKFFKNQ
jgi:hypothetical protein